MAIIGRGDEDLSLASTDAIWCDAVDLRGSIDRGLLGRAVDLYRGPADAGLLPLRSATISTRGSRTSAPSLHGKRRRRITGPSLNISRSRTSNFGYQVRAKQMTRLDMSQRTAASPRQCTMLDRLGDRAGALAIYTTYLPARLAKELDTEPSTGDQRMARSYSQRAAR